MQMLPLQHTAATPMAIHQRGHDRRSKTRSFLNCNAQSSPATKRDLVADLAVWRRVISRTVTGPSMKQVEFLFDHRSPFSYLANLQIEGLASAVAGYLGDQAVLRTSSHGGLYSPNLR